MAAFQENERCVPSRPFPAQIAVNSHVRMRIPPPRRSLGDFSVAHKAYFAVALKDRSVVAANPSCRDAGGMWRCRAFVRFTEEKKAASTRELDRPGRAAWR